jgi:hypothetical protein
LDVDERVEKLEELKASLPGAEEDVAKGKKLLETYNNYEIKENTDGTVKRSGIGSQKFKDQMIARANIIINKPQEIRKQIKIIESLASGGVIVNRPTYLPSSGVVVGEHPTYSGRGTPRDGGPEVVIGGAAAGAVIPLGADRASTYIDPVAKSVAGAVMNSMMVERMIGGGTRQAQAPTIVDASTVQNVSNNTLIRPPSPGGQLMAGERGDFVSKIA